MAYVIFNEDLGIYLGDAAETQFWSRASSEGWLTAQTFPSQQEAIDVMKAEMDPFMEYVFIEVIPDCHYARASVAACVHAGLPGWLHVAMPTANSLII